MTYPGERESTVGWGDVHKRLEALIEIATVDTGPKSLQLGMEWVEYKLLSLIVEARDRFPERQAS